jgi:hypothetical protein
MHCFTPRTPGSTFNTPPHGVVVMRSVRQALTILTAGALCLFAGCGLAPQGGMAERCADLMREAYPGADIQITKSGAAATSITTIVAHVEGIHRNLPANAALPQHIAVECRFHGDVLIGFRWTKGPT